MNIIKDKNGGGQAANLLDQIELLLYHSVFSVKAEMIYSRSTFCLGKGNYYESVINRNTRLARQ
jgi:hypothetical protein